MVSAFAWAIEQLKKDHALSGKPDPFQIRLFLWVEKGDRG
jgi:hypothetical protein